MASSESNGIVFVEVWQRVEAQWSSEDKRCFFT